MDGNYIGESVNGINTWHCYDNAEQLIGSPNPDLDAATYDSHGDTLSLGDSGSTNELSLYTSTATVT